MTIRTVGPNATYPTIAAAVAASAAGDTIRLGRVDSYERAELTVENLTVTAPADAFFHIDLVLGPGINDVTLGGLADIFTVVDNSGSNTITGNGGSNTVVVSGGTDVVHGGEGRDHLGIDYRAAVTSVVATANSVTDGGANSVTFDGFEVISIRGGSAADTLTVGDGDHFLYSGGGNDTITAGAGDTDIDSGGGDDSITAVGGEVRGGNGKDTIHIVNGGYVDAGPGNDTVTTGDGDNGVDGGAGDDTVTTGAGDDNVSGGHGNDTLKSGGGDDNVFFGDRGIDTADAGAGHDQLWLNLHELQTNFTVSISAGSAVGGYAGLAADATGQYSLSFTGFEHFEVNTGAGDDDVRIGAGNDTVRSAGGDDLVRAGAGDDYVLGGSGTDTVSGGAGDDYISGDGYFPEVFGGFGAADLLRGGRGDDGLSGAYGADTLIGGRGADGLQGWLGADVFLFDDLDSTVGASDVIFDLEARDTIDLSRIDADTTSAANQAFNFVATLSGTAGEATLRYEAGDRATRLILDTDGDGNADIRIIATGDHSDFSNFVL
jgi:Ca2+-binding RTX toxin-like protein